MGDVVRLFPKEPPAPKGQRSCHHCLNAAFSVNGTYCLTFQETIHSEKVAAADCPYYDEDESGERPMLIPHE